MMMNMGNCDDLHLKSSINDKWRLRVINEFLGGFQVKKRGPLIV